MFSYALSLIFALSCRAGKVVLASICCLQLSTSASATIDLVVVKDSVAQCSGASVTLQCTLAANTLIWITPDGALNFVRDRSNESEAGSYHGKLWEINSTHLRSNITFIITEQISIQCSDNIVDENITLGIEDVILQCLLMLCIEINTRTFLINYNSTLFIVP